MKTLAVGALLLVLLIPSAFAGSQRTHAGKVLCVELRGNKETIRDVKFRNTSKCKRGEQKIALPRGLRGPAGPAGTGRAAGTCRSDTEPLAQQVPAGPPGAPAGPFTRVTAFGGDFVATNASVSMTAECADTAPRQRRIGRRLGALQRPERHEARRHSPSRLHRQVLVRHRHERRGRSVSADIPRRGHSTT